MAEGILKRLNMGSLMHLQKVEEEAVAYRPSLGTYLLAFDACQASEVVGIHRTLPSFKDASLASSSVVDQTQRVAFHKEASQPSD